MIKFRGIPLEDVSSIDGVNFDGKFVYGNYAKNGDGALIIGDVLEAEEDVFWPSWWVPVDPKTVEQFTGLKDVNGKDIYEGDIIITHPKYGGEQSNCGVVQYGCSRRPEFSYKSKNGAYMSIWSSNTYRTYEVIGNVHENPELLEAEK